MTKADILKSTGLTEEEFYKRFPTQESYEKFCKGGKLPKYGDGADFKEQAIKALEAAGGGNALTGGIGMGAGMLAPVVENLAQTETGRVSVGGQTASGAMKGAAAGAMFGPWGAGIGALVGGAGGYIQGQQDLRQEKFTNLKGNFTDNLNEQAANIANAQYGKDYAGYGVGQMRNGGMVGPQYEAEGGEILQSPNISKLYGDGDLQRNSSNAVRLEGPSHDNGGMPMSTNGEGRIFSDKLKPTGEKKKTFADLADVYTKELGKLEKSEETSAGNAAKNTSKYMKKALNAKLDALFEAQEMQKAEKEEKRMQREFKKGGILPMAQDGLTPQQMANLSQIERDALARRNASRNMGDTDLDYEASLQALEDKKAAEIAAANMPISDALGGTYTPPNALFIRQEDQEAPNYADAFNNVGLPEYTPSQQSIREANLRDIMGSIDPKFSTPEDAPTLDTRNTPMDNFLNPEDISFGAVNEFEEDVALENEADTLRTLAEEDLANVSFGKDASQFLDPNTAYGPINEFEDVEMEDEVDAEDTFATDMLGKRVRADQEAKRKAEAEKYKYLEDANRMAMASAMPALGYNLYQGLFGKEDIANFGRMGATPGMDEMARLAGEYEAYNPAAELAAARESAGRARYDIANQAGGNLAMLMRGSLAGQRMSDQAQSAVLGRAEQMNVAAREAARQRLLGVKGQQAQDAKQTALFNLQQGDREAQYQAQVDAARQAHLGKGLEQLSALGQMQAINQLQMERLKKYKG